jgi:hypothetical protein
MPYVTSWHEKYKDKGFTVIGVHTPEFDFEKKESNVKDAIKRFGITYPVPLDNDYATWNAYSNRYWPAEYLFDAQGRLRYTHFGEGNYDVTEKNIQALLEEAGAGDGMAMTEVPTNVDFDKVGTPETYIGYARQELLGSPEKVLHDRPQTYSLAAKPALNTFYLSGKWIIGSEHALLDSDMGSIVYRYSASNANLVMGSDTDGEVMAEVFLDGEPVSQGFRGADLYEENGKTYARIQDERLYSLIDGRGSYGEHLLEIRFLDAGVQAYAFTFG